MSLPKTPTELFFHVQFHGLSTCTLQSILVAHSSQLRDCQQITSVTLNRFCLLSKKTPQTSCSYNGQYHKMEYTYQTKSDENGMLFLHHSYNSSFEGTSIIKICKIEPPDLLLLLFLLALYQQISFFTNIQDFN